MGSSRGRYFQITYSKTRQLFVVIFLIAVSMTCLSYFYTDNAYNPINYSDQGPAFIKFTGDNHDERANISKPKNIFFLKVHKSASSTIQNILLRYGASRSLNFVLPYTGNYLGHPEPFSKEMALPLATSTMNYNIFCHHSRFDQAGVGSIMPVNSVYLAILRDPVDLFESSFSYYVLSDLFQMSLEELLAMPSWWLAISERYLGKIGLNQIGFDFGINQSDFSDVQKLSWHISNLERSFDLVMIAERFDESLVLMKHLLNLDTRDIVYLKHNERLPNEKQFLNATMRDKVRSANYVDQKIYDHFYGIFLKMLSEFGEEKMNAELVELREQNDHWQKKCGVKKIEGRTKSPNAEMFQQHSEKVTSISLDNTNIEFCLNLAKSEMQYTAEIRRKHISNHGTVWQRFLYFIGYYQY